MWTAGEAGSGLIFGSIACSMQQIVSSQPQAVSCLQRWGNWHRGGSAPSWPLWWAWRADVCVGTRLSCLFLSVSASVTVLRLCELPSFCFLASPLLEDHHMVCCQLDTEPRDVTGVTSPQKRSVKCWFLITQDLQFICDSKRIYLAKIKGSLFHENE